MSYLRPCTTRVFPRARYPMRRLIWEADAPVRASSPACVEKDKYVMLVVGFQLTLNTHCTRAGSEDPDPKELATFAVPVHEVMS